MDELVIRAVESMGVWGVALLMFLENVFPPIPSEVIMPLAGYLAAEGRLSFAGAVIAGTIGTTLGATFWYILGRRWGREGARRWAEEHGRWVGLTPEDVDASAQWFKRHGRTAVLVGRMVPGVRAFISLPAGFEPMAAGPFLLFTLIGSALWVTGLAWVGRFVGERFHQVDRYLGPVTWVVIGVMLALYLRRIWQRRGRRR